MARKAGRLILRGPRTWLVRVSLSREPETGTRKYHKKTIRRSFREAQTYLNVKLQERGTGRLPPSSYSTVYCWRPSARASRFLIQPILLLLSFGMPIIHVVAQGVRCNAQKAVEERP